MKATYLYSIAIAIAICLGLPATGHTELKTEGKGRKLVLDSSQFSGEHKTRYEVFKKSCCQCHVMARPVNALIKGVTPISGEKFDAPGIKTYVVTMMRKPNSGITREQAKEIIKFLQHARSLVE